MYHPDAFNRAQLFQRLGGWMKSVAGGDKIRHYFSAVLQRAYHALFHIETATQLQGFAQRQFSALAAQLPTNTGEIRAASPMISATITHVTSAFSALRVFQDDVWQLLREASHATTAPNSIRDAVGPLALSGQLSSASRRPPRWVAQIPPALSAALVSYWESSGNLTATYRDTDQHHNVVATGCFVAFNDGSAVSVSIVLPDNPSAKSISKYTYQSRVDAISHLTHAFQEIHGLVETLATWFAGDSAPTPIPAGVDFVPPIYTVEGREAPLALQLLDYEGKVGLLFSQTPDRRMTIRRLQSPETPKTKSPGE